MKLKERAKNIGFWVSLLGSIFLILGAFGVKVPNATADSIVSAVCSLLVVLGIVSDPTKGSGYTDVFDENEESETEEKDKTEGLGEKSEKSE